MDPKDIFLSRILYLKNIEKEKGIKGKSNICKYYNIEDLKNILSIDNKKTYYEHLVDDRYIRLVIDYDNPNIINLKEIKKLFFKDVYKFISRYVSIDYKEFKNGIAISKSNNTENTKLHIVYSNIIMSISTLITLMKEHFKSEVNIEYVDYSIYKNNFNLRLVYSSKPDKTNQLIPLINKNAFNHLATYYNINNSYVISNLFHQEF